jgi:hypothetical protein
MAATLDLLGRSAAAAFLLYLNSKIKKLEMENFQR